MPFTAHDLRYHAEESYPLLCAYLQRYAQRFLGSMKFDAFELDLVVGHVIEQLVRFGLIGGGDRTPLTALDNLTDAQFMAFLNRSLRNKIIDRWRKRHLQVSTLSELETPEGAEGEDNLLNDVVEPVWGPPPFATPEDAALAIASQRELRNLLKHCIMALGAAPHQLQAVLQEIEEMGCAELLHLLTEELAPMLPSTEESARPPTNPAQLAHLSQHKDHAHRKLRHCLQEQSTNLTVTIALRLTEYGVHNPTSNTFEVDMRTLAQDDLSASDVRLGLTGLVAQSLLDWHCEEIVRLTATQRKRLSRYYREE